MGDVALPLQGDGDVLTGWALAGRGFVLKPLWEVVDFIKDGRLVPILTNSPPEPVALSVLYPHRRLLPARVKAFSDFAVARFAEEIERRLDGLTLAGLRDRQRKPAKRKRGKAGA